MVDGGYDQIAVTQHGKVGLIEFTSAERLNAIEPKTSEAEVADALRSFESETETNVVVLFGRGRAFSVGAYLGPPRKPRYEADQARTIPQRVAYGYAFGDFWKILESYRKPLIAAVNGYALGGGWKIAFLCDMIIAGESAILGSAELDLGLPPSPLTSHYLPKMLGKHRAFEAFAFSQRFTAREAEALGLVNRVVPDEECLETALSIAADLAERPAVALALTKQLMSRAMALDSDYDLERALASMMRLDEATIETMNQARNRHKRKQEPSSEK